MDGRGLGGSVLGGQGQARCLEVNPGREESQGADHPQLQAQLLLSKEFSRPSHDLGFPSFMRGR